jgi:hypothetical protein
MFRNIHKLGLNEFAWQGSFYDHVIRKIDSYESIASYIIDNPTNWKKDVFGICIHFLYIVNALYGLFVVGSIFPFIDYLFFSRVTISKVKTTA